MNNLRRIVYFSKLMSKRNAISHRSAIPCCNIIVKHYASSFEVKTIPQTPSKKLMTKLLDKVSFLSISKNRLKVTGYLLYESIADNINYPEIFQKLNLPDTFYSWFVITELYIWMVMVRYMAEGEEGRQVRNRIVEALWGDCNHRVKKLGAANPGGVRMQVSELSEQLNAALIAYDEGLQSDDVVLAGALWRRLYQQQTVDPEHLDSLVKYIRRQIKLLDSMTKYELFEERCIKWEPFNI
ncbi:hypothetical protein ILUMI_11659 [Ignelater luminosus]|uniref:Ubiquinol-cytochrome c chaperone domain-containing protein n=1 Tax=Ignelater luminosus TaxID=2038154 RepID=A0A8K0CZR4_IGNLU|nr:hypothetical protein ILUMI_11659 [Ignelater luminosus]